MISPKEQLSSMAMIFAHYRLPSTANTLAWYCKSLFYSTAPLLKILPMASRTQRLPRLWQQRGQHTRMNLFCVCHMATIRSLANVGKLCLAANVSVFPLLAHC